MEKKLTKKQKLALSNALKGNKRWLGKKHTEESKKKMSESKNAFKKKIQCLNNGIIYDSIRQASISLNVTKSDISSVIKGKAKQTKGYTFRLVQNG